MSAESPPDVLIVGAGPAGSTLAYLLAGRGWRVELLDRARFPRPKPCGECLNPGAVKALARIGLLESVMALSPAPITGWRIRSARGDGGTGRFGDGLPTGLGVSREALDHALVRCAVARGVRLEEGVRVMRMIRPARGGSEEVATTGPGSERPVSYDAGSKRPVSYVAASSGGGSAGAASDGVDPPPLVETLDADGHRGTRAARFVVGADGLRSAVARRLDMTPGEPGLRKISLTCRLAGKGPPRTTGFLHLGDHGTVGLAPVEGAESEELLWNGTIVVSAARGPEMKGSARRFFRRAFDHAGIRWKRPGYEVIAGPWPSGAFDWPARRVVDANLLLVGDAAGYFDPLTGQGIFRALRSAELAFRAIDRSLRNPRESTRILRRYAKLLEREFRPGRRVQRIIEGVISRPRLREGLLRRLDSTPGALDALIRVTGDGAPARSLLAPGFRLALPSIRRNPASDGSVPC